MSRRPPTTTIRRIVKEIEETGTDCSPKSYRRAATQRLDAARFLLKNSNYYLDALYLAGYAAECALKALILKRTPKSKWAAVREEISSGAKAHNMDFLKGILNRKQCLIPASTEGSLDAVKHEWMPELRYVGALIPSGEAANFIKHVTLVY